MDQTQEFNEQAKKENKLTEAELDAVAGGAPGRDVVAVDSHDPEVCSTFTDTEHRCLGLRTKTPCVHYRSTSDYDKIGMPATQHRKCLMGYFDNTVPFFPY